MPPAPRSPTPTNSSDTQWTSLLAAPAAPAQDPELPAPEPTKELHAVEGLVKAPLMADALQQQVCCRATPARTAHQGLPLT